MRKFVSSFVVMTAFLLVMSYLMLPGDKVSAAAIKDGSYQISYEIKEASSNNTSIADGYFTKPATLTVKNGVKTVQLKVTSAKMIKSLSTPNGPVTIVKDTGDTRTVKFKVGNLQKPLQLKMHVIVPEDALPGGYDMRHTARAIFDVSGLAMNKSADAAVKKDYHTKANNQTATTPKKEDNPQTGDDSAVWLYGLLFVGALTILVVMRKVRSVRK